MPRFPSPGGYTHTAARGSSQKKGGEKMAGRPPKKNIDFSGWSVDMFDSDPKIDKLLDAQGWTGFGVYFFLCQRAYGSEGYFYRWSCDDAATTARKMGGGVGSETVKQTVGLCLQIGLFDNRLFVGDGILTSRGIQKRYWAVVSDRPRKSIIPEFWLLSEEEAPGAIKSTIKSNLSPIIANLSPINGNYTPIEVNRSKLNKIEVEEIGGFATATDILSYQQGMTQIEQTAQSIGLPLASADIDRAESLMADYGADWVCQAINRASLREKRSWGMVVGILKSWKQKGGIDDGEYRRNSAKMRSHGGRGEILTANGVQIPQL